MAQEPTVEIKVALVNKLRTISRPYRTMREAIYHARSSAESEGELAVALDMQPSALSSSASLHVPDPPRYFPADKLIELCEATGNYSPLLTLAEALGYRCIPCGDVDQVAADLDRHARALRGER